MDPAMMALAVVASQELVKVMVGDGWVGVRAAVVGWFGRGDTGRQERQAAQLDQTRDELLAGTVEFAVAAARWQGRLEGLIEEDPGLAEELSALVTRLQSASGTPVAAGKYSLTAGGDVHIEAHTGAAATGVLDGSVFTGGPRPPGPAQG